MADPLQLNQEEEKVDNLEAPQPTVLEHPQFSAKNQKDTFLGGGGQTETLQKTAPPIETTNPKPKISKSEAERLRQKWWENDHPEEVAEIDEMVKYAGISPAYHTALREGDESAADRIKQNLERLEEVRKTKAELSDEERERRWKEEPYTAALNSVIDIINKKLVEGREPITVDDIRNNPDFTLSADFVDRVDDVQKKWRLIVDNKEDDDGKILKRIAVRNLNGNYSEHFGITYKSPFGFNPENNPLEKAHHRGIAVLEGNKIDKYHMRETADIITSGWDYNVDHLDLKEDLNPYVPIMDKSSEEYIAVKRQKMEKYIAYKRQRREKYTTIMREYFDNCLEKPDKVELKKVKSPQLKERLVKTGWRNWFQK